MMLSKLGMMLVLYLHAFKNRTYMGINGSS